LPRIVRGEAEHARRAQNAAGVGGRQIFLADMQAGVEQRRDVGAVIDDESGAGAGAQRGNHGRVVEVARGPVLFRA